MNALPNPTPGEPVLWSAVTCHPFDGLGDLSPKQSRVQRVAGESGRPPAFDGDKSPAESAARSMHSKACGGRLLPLQVLGTTLLSLSLLTGCGKSDSSHTGHATQAERKVLYYQSAMHPWIKSDKPGRCTICGMQLTPVYEGEAGLAAGDDVVRLSPTAISVLNVQTAAAARRPLSKTLPVAGTIEASDTSRRVLSAYIGGRIDKLHVSYVGAEVKAGEPLAEFYSPTLLQAEREYRALAGTANDDLRQAAALRLRQMGLTAEQIAALADKPADALTSQILAPGSGTVIERNVTAGQYVNEGERLFELADFSTMWFQAQVYEPDLPWIKPGLKVVVTTPSLPGETFTGEITFIEPSLDPATRATRVRVELPNPLVDVRRKLLHRTYADGRVQLAAPEVLAVPRSAVIQIGPEAVVYVDQGDGAYERRVLKIGRRGDALVEVLEGLEAGEKVVVNGNLLMDGQAEMNRGFTPPMAIPMTAPPTVGELPPLTDDQRQAMREFFALVDGLGVALAADDLAAFNREAPNVHTAAGALFAAFKDIAPWLPLIQAVEGGSHLATVTDLKEARRSFYPLSTATVALAQAARTGDSVFAALRIYRCPMTKDAFAGAPNRAEWIQLRPEVRNPWFGAEMLECGVEVKP
jgi:Cu(I)/Ag(I) efflux system membrane fusion protein